MRHGHQGLDAVLQALVVVELKSFLVGLRVVGVGEDPGPCDGHTVHLKAHLRKHLDILFVMMVEV